MKKSIWLLLALLTVSVLFAYEGIEYTGAQYGEFSTQQEIINRLVTGTATTKGNVVNYSFTLDMKNLPDIDEILADKRMPALVRTFAIPAKEAKLTVGKLTVVTYTQKEDKWTLTNERYLDPEKDKEECSKMIYILQDFIFREARGFSVFVDLFTRQDDELHIITSAEWRLDGSGDYDTPTEISEAFEPAYRSLIDNFDTSYLVDLQYKKPSMIILTQPGLMNNTLHRAFVSWKRSIGFDVYEINKNDIPSNSNPHNIKTYLENYYNNMENKADYLLIVGGARSNATHQMPTFESSAPNGTQNGTDMPYSLLAGDDYFPEVIIGRFSVSNNNQAFALYRRSPGYERGGFTNTNNWMNRGITVGANYDSGGANVTTPILMSRWIADKMRTFGFNTTELYYQYPAFPPASPNDIVNTQATTPDIVTAVNRSAQYITYRGWGNAQGWEYPEFKTANLVNTNNGGRLPIVYSIVCGTGDYLHPTYDPCLAEAWMIKENQGDLDGAAAFVAPTYLHTSTEYNNSIGSGMIYGVFEEGIRIFGASVMRGKIELYRNYPRELDFNGTIHFYWSTYNILSDPSLNMWFGEPATIDVALPTQVSAHTGYIEINATNIDKGYATATKDNQTFTYARIVNGQAILPLPVNETGPAYIITIFARNHNPIFNRVIMIDTSDAQIGLIGAEVTDGQFAAGQTAVVSVTLKNFATQELYAYIQELTSTSPYVEFILSTPEVLGIQPNETADAEYTITLAHNCPDDIDIAFEMPLYGKFALATGGYKFAVMSIEPTGGHILAGETKAIAVNLKNISTIDATGFTAVISTQSDAVSIADSSIALSDIAAGAETSFSFTLEVARDCYTGKNIRFEIDFIKDEMTVTSASFNQIIGIVTTTAPTGPDNYGYYAYDMTDTTYVQAPVYEWIDINPENGGAGTIVSLPDDTTAWIPLPFTFRFYGEDFDELCINDNGWIAFMDSTLTFKTDFRNWYMPSPLGPPSQIAVFWDDMKGKLIPDTTPREWEPMQIKYWHDAINNRFIVQWDDVYFSRDDLQTAGHLEYQVILEPRNDADGDIIMQYKNIRNYQAPGGNHANFASIGIQNKNHSDGLTYTYSDFYPASATPIQNGLAIRFTTEQPILIVKNEDEVIHTRGSKLLQNYPNPFNPSTTIAFSIGTSSNSPVGTQHAVSVQIDIYNIKGQKVRSLVNGTFGNGTHKVIWNGQDDRGRDMSSGIYFYRLKTENTVQTKKMILMK